MEDACVVGDIVVLGFNSGPSQVTFLPVTVRVLHLRVTRHSCSVRRKLLADWIRGFHRMSALLGCQDLLGRV